ncbi:putative enzyme related to lactoylglutathione lyase [Enterococcus sp. PF1-24]|uniref:VOC family protein n=1 Tax=unclassified Enterococcus TaxID=2608891 RepID=UPI002474DEFC|nr:MULTISPECIES: VOC family protein [unclassified Enterococcus]MDH6363051.1 putative enzyme related to lactoylglutathione lyase [Enterococcus sp. PFB1-1]MDH6400145.1 putative enzyme related to lactoylglutathione lyase [Enterococcus sp. PF1-24]
MKFGGTLLIVENIEKAKKFYQDILQQTVTMDLGEHAAFENGLSLQANYEGIVGQPLKKLQRANNFQLYFEVVDIEECEQRFKENPQVTFLHNLKAYPWKQRSIRIYDVDKNIIEIAESMDSVIKNCLKQGLTVAETAEITMYPAEYVMGFV